MKKLSLSCLILLSYSCIALSEPVNSSKASDITINNKNDREEDASLTRELNNFQRVQREGEYLKLKIKNKNLMDQLGIKDRDDIFDDDTKAVDVSSQAQKKTFLVSTFKVGKGAEKARVFVLGRGIMTVKNGDYIMDNVKILSINHGSAKAIVMATGYTYELSKINVF